MKNLLYSCLTVLLLMGNALWAQKEKDLYKIKATYVVNLANTDSTIRAEVFYDHKDIKPNEHYTYYWFYINKIISTKGGYDGRLLHGVYSCYYSNSNLRQRGEFYHGMKSGIWFSWSPDGKMLEESKWKHSQRNGITKTFGSGGELQSEMYYKNDKLNGYVINYDKSGKITSKKKYKNNTEVQKKKLRMPDFSKLKKLFKKKPKITADNSRAQSEVPAEQKQAPVEMKPEEHKHKEKKEGKAKKWLHPLKKEGDKK